MPETDRPCSRCGATERRADGRCAPCARAYHAAYYASNREKVLSYQAARYAANPERERARQNPERARARALLRIYGLTPDDYEVLRAHQDGGCAVCGRIDGSARGEALHVDHHHKSGAVRGLLCARHNYILGHLNDDAETLIRLGRYLEDPPAFRALGRIHKVPKQPPKRRRGK